MIRSGVDDLLSSYSLALSHTHSLSLSFSPSPRYSHACSKFQGPELQSAIDRIDGVAVLRTDTEIIPGPTSAFQRFHASPTEPRECLDTPPSIIIIVYALS